MPKLDRIEKPVKPADFAENQILTAILDGSYAPGDALPAERVLAQSLGVTRPTLRETLQRLAKEGWITIAHGKPTRVNDYLFSGGLGVLNTLARYGDHISPELVDHFLEIRTFLFPGVTQKAVEKDPDSILAYLEKGPAPEASSDEFAVFDWGLQMLMVTVVGNPVLKMISNDFFGMYQLLGERYFSNPDSKARSLNYYRALGSAIREGDTDLYSLVESTMEEARKFWEVIL